MFTCPQTAFKLILAKGKEKKRKREATMHRERRNVKQITLAFPKFVENVRKCINVWCASGCQWHEPASMLGTSTLYMAVLYLKGSPNLQGSASPSDRQAIWQ